MTGPCRVRVCRDCCCGTSRKHPGVDHDRLLARLSARVSGAAAVDVTACLLACEWSNVVVVSPSPAGRRAGGRSAWLKEVLDDPAVDAIVDWVAAGGPGLAEMPGALKRHHCPVPALAVAAGLDDRAAER